MDRRFLTPALLVFYCDFCRVTQTVSRAAFDLRGLLLADNSLPGGENFPRRARRSFDIDQGPGRWSEETGFSPSQATKEGDSHANNAFGDCVIPQRGGVDIDSDATIGLRWWGIWPPQGINFTRSSSETLVHPATCLRLS